MRKLWIIGLISLLIAAIWWARSPLPNTDANHVLVEIEPAPINARPLVHNHIVEVSTAKKRVAPEPNRIAVLKHNFVRLLEREAPEGRGWESLSDAEFIETVEEWSFELTQSFDTPVTHDELYQIAYDMHADLASPYGRYVLFTWAVRFGTMKDADTLLMRLRDEPLIQQSSDPEDPKTERDEERASRLMGNELLNNYARTLLDHIGKEQAKKMLEGNANTIGGNRIDSLIDDMPKDDR